MTSCLSRSQLTRFCLDQARHASSKYDQLQPQPACFCVTSLIHLHAGCETTFKQFSAPVRGSIVAEETVHHGTEAGDFGVREAEAGHVGVRDGPRIAVGIGVGFADLCFVIAASSLV